VATIKELKEKAYEKAIDSLARYKFIMFGYWAAIWGYLNQIDTDKGNNPFKGLVKKARQIQRSESEH